MVFERAGPGVLDDKLGAKIKRLCSSLVRLEIIDCKKWKDRINLSEIVDPQNDDVKYGY